MIYEGGAAHGGTAWGGRRGWSKKLMCMMPENNSGENSEYYIYMHYRFYL